MVAAPRPPPSLPRPEIAPIESNSLFLNLLYRDREAVQGKKGVEARSAHSAWSMARSEEEKGTKMSSGGERRRSPAPSRSGIGNDSGRNAHAFRSEGNGMRIT